MRGPLVRDVEMVDDASDSRRVDDIERPIVDCAFLRNRPTEGFPPISLLDP